MKAFVKKYVQQGFCVFPLPYKSKVPFQGWNWKVLQTRQPSQANLDSWFQDDQRVNVAVVTGRVSGNLAVLDFDNMTVFPAWYDNTRLESATVMTRNGCHVYVKILDPESLHNGNFQVAGVHAGQIRFDGGYVVAPPSVHPSGKAYQWIDDFPDRPVSVVRVENLGIEQEPKKGLAKTPVDQESVNHQRQAFKTSQSHGVKHPELYARAVLRREAEQVKHSKEGLRNSVLFRSALKTWKLVPVLGVSIVFHELQVAGMACGLSEQESTTTIKKAWKYGHY